MSGRPGTLSIQTSRQTARNHFYRCRGHQGNKTTVNQHEYGFLLPSLSVTDVCAIYATNYRFMAKSSPRRVTIYINGKEVEASVKQIRAEMNRLVNEQNRMVIVGDFARLLASAAE